MGADRSAVPTAQASTGSSTPRTDLRRHRDHAVGSGQPVWTRLITHGIAVLIALAWFVPVLALVIGSFRTERDNATSGWWTAFTNPAFTTDNYNEAMATFDLWSALRTSLLIAVPTTIGTVMFAAIGAFAIGTMTFRGKVAVQMLLVALLVIPPQLTLVPVLRIFSAAGLMGTVPAVWIYQVGFTVPYGIFLLRGFIVGIPKSLLEAAAIDGASALRVFRSIVIPVAAPVMASLAIMQFLWSWNDLLIPLLFLGGSAAGTPITVEVSGLVQSTGLGQSMVLAATCVSILLPLLIILSMQRYFVRGVLGGAIKG